MRLPLEIKSHGFAVFIRIACCADLHGVARRLLMGCLNSLLVEPGAARTQEEGWRVEWRWGACVWRAAPAHLSGTGGQGRHVVALNCATVKLLCLHLRLEMKEELS